MNDKPVHVLAVGEFGEDVAERLSRSVPNSLVTRAVSGTLPFPALWPSARLHILVAWRPVPALAGTLDEVCHMWNTPWLYVVMDHPHLQVGPLVVPGESACYQCGYRRWLQHSPHPDLIRPVHEGYDAQPTLGPAGYLPSFAGLAAALSKQYVDGLDRRDNSFYGRIRRHHLLNNQSLTGTVVGIHGCSRCGIGRDERTRSYSQLLEDVGAIPAAVLARRGGGEQ